MKDFNESTKVLFQNAQEVYESLEDHLSKGIFLNRLNYSISRDMRYCKEMPGNERFNESTRFHNPLAPSETLLDELRSLPKKLVIYGACNYGKLIYAKLLGSGVDADYFWDRNHVMYAEGFLGKEVLAPNPTGNERIVIGSWIHEKDMIENLVSIGIDSKDIIVFDYNLEHRDISNQYFDEDIIQFSDEEVFIDAGVFDLYTSENLLKKCSTVKKIYGFEPSESLYEFAKNKNLNCDIELVKAGLWSKKSTLNFFAKGSLSRVSENGAEEIQVVALDEVVSDHVTFIKMDIEGSELEALKGSEKIIKKYKPKLAISVYHKPEDIIDIPKLIKSIVPEYKLYMRHYTDCSDETVLYAVQ